MLDSIDQVLDELKGRDYMYCSLEKLTICNQNPTYGIYMYMYKFPPKSRQSLAVSIHYKRAPLYSRHFSVVLWYL